MFVGGVKVYKVERAIIMAAGKGVRLQPVTLKTPKPLVPVNGIRMIDTIINALHKNEIHEIYIVVGYLKEQFLILEKEYDGIHIIENPYYDTCNNISSLYVARNYIENAIILDGDQIINDYKVLTPYFMKSGYNVVYTETNTNEWLLNVEDSVVVGCSRNGGSKGWQLFSVSRWNSQDGKKLKSHIELEFEVKKNREIYWDDVALFCYPQEYELGIHKMDLGDIIEIDNIDELIKIDKSYIKHKVEV